MPPTDTTADLKAMSLQEMLDNKMHLVRPVELRDVIEAAQAVCKADDDYVADEADQYPHAVLDAVDVLRMKLAGLVEKVND